METQDLLFLEPQKIKYNNLLDLLSLIIYFWLIFYYSFFKLKKNSSFIIEVYCDKESYQNLVQLNKRVINV